MHEEKGNFSKELEAICMKEKNWKISKNEKQGTRNVEGKFQNRHPNPILDLKWKTLSSWPFSMS
jgi:hypothetical protein